MAAKKAKTQEVAATAPDVEKTPKLKDAGWRDPKSVYADDDQSIDARMWRLNRDHQNMGVRPK